MRWATAKAEEPFAASKREALNAALRERGGLVRWRVSTRAGRSYALLELPDEVSSTTVAEAAAAVGAVAYETPVIALAVFPAVAEALPALISALAGAGGPAGIRSCEPCRNAGAAIEWDLDRTRAGVVLGLVDVELGRFASGRTAELLTPLTPAWTARIAADGLAAPEIGPDRILETLIERAGLRVPTDV
ncbi:MAG TPA: hypothetical protein VGF86_06290 [Candidatus Tumulicola sp.]